MNVTKMYVVRTTFIGAGSYSEFYFVDLDAAEEFFSKCKNGEIEKEYVFGTEPDDLWNNMTWDEICHITGKTW